MNLVVEFLVRFGFKEEEAFWMVVFIFENLFPKFHFKNLVSIQLDLKFLGLLLQKHCPQLALALSKVDPDLASLIAVYLTFFTNVDNHQLNCVALDNCLAKPQINLIKIILYILHKNQKVLLKIGDLSKFQKALLAILKSFKFNLKNFCEFKKKFI